MGNQLNILFYVKRKEKLKTGEMPILCRISINKSYCSFSTGLSVKENLWSVKRKRLIGRSDKARQTNTLLDKIHYSVYDAYIRLLRSDDELSPKAVRRIYLGESEDSMGIVRFFREHNDEFEQMVGLNRSISTLYKYRYVCNHLHSFIADKYNMTDMPLKKITYSFICEFHRWLSETAGCSVNTVWIYMIAFKHIMMRALGKGLLSNNPFIGYKLHSEQADKNFLMKNELRKLLKITLPSPSQALVLDAFLFSCFTGLAYIDLKDLTMNDIIKSSGGLIISAHRTKTKTGISVPLLQIPHKILMKYYHGEKEKPIFDLPSNG